MIKILKRRNYVIALLSILVVSILFNIYNLFEISSFKYIIGKQSYIKIEDLRQRSESNMDMLKKIIESESVESKQMLKLYKNYDSISNDIISLLQQYSEYKQGVKLLDDKEITTNAVIEKDIHGKIKQYIMKLIINKPCIENNKLELDEQDLMYFNSMYNLSKDLYVYFDEFNEKNLNSYEGEKRKDEIIKNKYWINMLDGIYSINNNYIDIEWNIELDDN